MLQNCCISSSIAFLYLKYRFYRRHVKGRLRIQTVCLAVCLWFSLCTPASFINGTVRHDIIEILLKAVLNTVTPPHPILHYISSPRLCFIEMCLYKNTFTIIVHSKWYRLSRYNIVHNKRIFVLKPAVIPNVSIYW